MATKRKKTTEEKPTSKKLKLQQSNKNDDLLIDWLDYELLADKEGIDINLSQTLVNLLDNENTIPFLCRYRKHLIQNTSPEKLRDIQSTLDAVRDLKCKIENFYKTLEKKQEVNEELKSDLKAIKSIDELDFFKSLYKSEGKRTLYEKAKELGLNPLACDVLTGNKKLDFNIFVDTKVEGLKSAGDVEKGVKDILVHMIVKNKLVIEEIRRLKDVFTIRIESKKTKTAKDDKNGYKFETYFDFTLACSNLKPHQILALFRGESMKILKLSFTFHDLFAKNLNKFAKNELLQKRGSDSDLRTKIFDDAFKEAFSKRISPFVVRQLRSELQKLADKAAISSFADNLKNLLLTVPVKGKKILGVDPGFKNGCKMALISESGEILDTSTIYPHVGSESRMTDGSKTLVDMLTKHSCSLIALGNGTACRETETFLDRVMKLKRLDNVEYCIVSEQGASIYSCSDVAAKEFPKMDTNIISAVSIARRLMDPLSELVKIEPKHLGVGMYQHDVDEKLLGTSLNAIVSECVSYVGVDVNCASLSILKHVAGLTEKKALSILDHRKKHGPFKSREELLKVKSIGDKTFTQMIGFIRIEKATAGSDKINVLDSTSIHPESYEVVKKILKDCGLKVDDVGRKSFMDSIQKYHATNLVEKLAVKFKEEVELVENVLNVLRNESINYDYRNETNYQPDFKKGLQKLSDLKSNQIVNGVVRNIVDFGAFIDIGVQQDGLLHKSKYKKTLKLGDKVECKIISISENGKRIALDFVNML